MLAQVVVKTASEGVMRGAKLFLTSRRIVLIPDEKQSRWLPAGLAKLVSKTTAKISHQIRRSDFGSVEPTGSHALKVRSQGEGYGMTWFEVEDIAVDTWKDRIERWANESD